jgi:type VI protein secretion system component VasF
VGNHSRFPSTEQEQEELRRELEQRIDAVERRTSRLHAQLQQDQAERDRERREQVRTTVRLQGVGTVLILVGLVLGVLGVLLQC